MAYVSNPPSNAKSTFDRFRDPARRYWVLVSGGVEPAWARNGELFYRRPTDYAMMAVSVATNPALTVGHPKSCFAVGLPGGHCAAGGSPRASTQ